MLNLRILPELRLSRRGPDPKIGLDWISSLHKGMEVRNNSLDRSERFLQRRIKCLKCCGFHLGWG